MHFITAITVTAVILGLAHSQDPVAVAEPAPQKCDLVAAVKCFSTMGDISQPHTITGNPMGEIETPCKAQTETFAKLKKCLETTLTGCPSIISDSTMLIGQSEYFCKKVTDCQDFSAKYKNSLACSLQMFTDLMEPSSANKATSDCNSLSTCITLHVKECPAMAMFLEEQWNLFQRSCEIAGVKTPEVLTPVNETTTAPVAICPKLTDVTMAISMCHDVMLNTVKDAKANITIHCMAAKTFIDCANTTLVKYCPVTSGYQKIFLASIKEYMYALSPLCGDDMTETGVCNMGEMQTCFAQMTQSMWRVEQNVIEQNFKSATVNITAVVERASQITSIAKDLPEMCKKANDTIFPMETCLKEETKGCEEEVQEVYLSNTEFLKNLCVDLKGCGDMATISTEFGKCTTQAELALKALKPAGITDKTQLTDKFCKIFDDIMTCMDKYLETLNCYNTSEHIHAIYELLGKDLSDVCDTDNFTVLNSFRLSDELEDFIDCSELPTISYSIGLCTSEYLQTLAQNPTKPDVICQALDRWENCSNIAVMDCDMMYDHIIDMGDKARENMPYCQRATPPPPTVAPTTPKESDNETTNGTPITVTDKDGNIIVQTTPESAGTVVTSSTSALVLTILTVLTNQLLK